MPCHRPQILCVPAGVPVRKPGRKHSQRHTRQCCGCCRVSASRFPGLLPSLLGLPRVLWAPHAPGMGAAVAAAAALFALAAVAGPHQRATATLTSRLPVSLLLRGGNAPRDKDNSGAADVISGGHGIEYQRPAAEGGERHEILAEALSHLEGEGCDLDGNEGKISPRLARTRSRLSPDLSPRRCAGLVRAQ